jgi:hypothetical protein
LSCKKSSDNTDDDSVGNSKQQQHHLATPVAAATNLGYKTVAPQQRHLATQAAASTNRHFNIVALHNNAAHQQQPTAALHNNSNQQSRCITTGYLVRFSFFFFVAGSLTRLIYNTVALIPLRLIAQLRRTTTATSDRAAQQQVYWSSLFIYFIHCW